MSDLIRNDARFALGALVWALLALSAPGFEPLQPEGATRDGTLVSVTGNKLVMIDEQGHNERTCTLTAGVKITCDGQPCTAGDLRPGMRVRVTSASDNPHAATYVEALDKNLEFARA